MSDSRHDSCSSVEHCSLVESSHVDASNKSPKTPLDYEKTSEAPKKSNSFDRKLMRDRQATPEPRYFVYVYDYSENKTKIMRRSLLEKRDSEKIEQAPIPSKGSLAISTGNNGFGGGKTVVARVHINLALRLQKWLGLQKQLYIVDAMKRDTASETRFC